MRVSTQTKLKIRGYTQGICVTKMEEASKINLVQKGGGILGKRRKKKFVCLWGDLMTLKCIICDPKQIV